MEKRLYTITAFTENSPGVLHRITVLFTRRKINIESLTVSETETKGISRFTISVRTTKDLASKIVKQIHRIIECRSVSLNENRELLFKEIALYKVGAETAEQRKEIDALANRHSAAVIHAANDYLIIENTGSEDEIRSLYRLLESFGMKEFVRSGRISLQIHPPAISEKVEKHPGGEV